LHLDIVSEPVWVRATLFHIAFRDKHAPVRSEDAGKLLDNRLMGLERDMNQRVVRDDCIDDIVAERECCHISLDQRRLRCIPSRQSELFAGEIETDRSRFCTHVSEDGCPRTTVGIEDSRRPRQRRQKFLEDSDVPAIRGPYRRVSLL
jgi:hypothetical protein